MIVRKVMTRMAMVGLLAVATACATSALAADGPKTDQPIAGWTEKTAPAVVELTLDDILNAKGDGPDGKGNSDDDTWGFWFQLANDADSFSRLSLHTATMSEDQRKNGIVDAKARRGKRKVQGPIAGYLPNPADTDGWILHTDWDGRFEGVWADKKAKQIIMYPYVEKNFHGAVAVTYRVPATGTYTISGKITDLQSTPQIAKHDGVSWWVQVAGEKPAVMLGKGGPVGDGDENNKRPNSAEFKIEKVKIGGGRLVRLVIHPNAWWGADNTRIDYLKIEKQ